MVRAPEPRAWRVLHGRTLADKLATEADLAWDRAIPEAPGRGDGWGLPPRGARVRAVFPSPNAVDRAEVRGTVLHFFANHELLALELLAAAILRFPDTPLPFRLGLEGILEDEQRHLAAYVHRMGATGVTLGEVPMNRYFWDALSGVDDPRRFLAGLALTFEQANLDFAARWAGAFRAAGDEVTARVLDGVLEDEIRHVRHGLSWFQRWTPPGGSLWDDVLSALPAPLTPARAKADPMLRAPRERAGFDADYLDRLAVFAASKGRPPLVHLFVPDVESEVARGSAVEDPTTAGIAADLAGVLLFLVKRDDVAVLPRLPSVAFLAELARAGVTLPEIVPDLASLEGRTLGGFAPWGWGPAVAARLGPLDAGARWEPPWRALYEKSWSVQQLAAWPDLCDPAVVGVACADLASVDAATAEFGPSVVWKAPLGTAGRGARRPSDPDARAWVAAVLAGQGAVVVEPWLDRVADVSLQFDVRADGSVHTYPWAFFLTNARGGYLGAVLGRQLVGADAALRRVAGGFADVLGEVARRLGREMAARGYVGPAGLDALVWRDGEALRLKPLVELNPRVTMGRVALAVGARVRAAGPARWLHLSRAAIRRRGHPSFARLAEAARGACPVIVEDGRVTEGIWFTTDPDAARERVTLAAVGERALRWIDG